MKIELVSGGKRYQGWENITITKSILSIADTFTMQINKSDAIAIDYNDKIQIYKDGNLFLTGYIDEINESISDKISPLSIVGRSKAGDLIDCNIEDVKQYNNQSLIKIIKDLIKDFDVKVSTNIENITVEKFDAQIGETFFSAINRLCKQTNTFPVSTPSGDILITKNTQSLFQNTIKDSQLKSITYPRKLNEIYSKYVYKKEGIITDVTDATEKEDVLTRYRPFVELNNQDKTNEDMAKWKKTNAKANAISLNITLVEWEIEPNKIVKINSKIVKNDFLVKSATYTKGNDGTISQYELISKDLYV